MKIWDSFAVALVITVMLFGLYKLSGNKQKFDISQVAHAISVDAKAPRMIDAETRIDSVTGIGDTLTFKYTLVNYTKFDLPRQVSGLLKTQINKTFCQKVMADPAIRSGFEQFHLTFNSKFYNSTGMILESYEMRAEDCS
jgi:hypothetical protein